MSATVDTLPRDEHASMSHRQVLLVLSGLMLGMFLAALDQSIVSTALKTIVTDLGGGEHVAWVVAAYLLASTATTPLYGKISDLYGRKRVYQFAISIFLIGSVLAGLSEHMWQLILFRAIQGLGGGGLMSLALTIIGDIVSPRERGRYQGYFGAVFAVSSVAGPLLGGFFTDSVSWHSIFYINVPIGIAALITVSARLNIPYVRREHKIDYLGAILFVAGVSAVLLVTQWGGTQYPWGSARIVGLAIIGVALLIAFGFVEKNAAEPILPLRLFRNHTFRMSNFATFVIGCTMFGALIYMPFYFQLVRHHDATTSGLLMLPLMVGILTASITSGRVISHIGRFKPFPVVGTAVMAGALVLMSTISTTTPMWAISCFLVLLGAGLGMTMQPLVLAVQNSSDPRELGVATSATSFFRSFGGAVGTAVFGAIVNAGAHLTHQSANGSAGALNLSDYTNAIGTAFLVAIPLMVLAFVVTWFLKDARLRATSGLAAQSESGELEKAKV